MHKMAGRSFLSQGKQYISSSGPEDSPYANHLSGFLCRTGLHFKLADMKKITSSMVALLLFLTVGLTAQDFDGLNNNLS